MAVITTDLKKYFKTNSVKMAHFVKWYVDSDKSKESYESECKVQTQADFEYVMQEWVVREDVQLAIKKYIKMQSDIKMIEMYEAMYQKAIEKGDVKCAEWCQKFYKSDFFKESEENEIDNYLNDINIPELGDSNG